MTIFPAVRYHGEVQGDTIAELDERATQACQAFFANTLYARSELDVTPIKNVGGRVITYEATFMAWSAE